MDFVDTHFHIWDLKKFSYPWPTPDMKIYKDYYLCDLENAVKGTPVKHAIFVQVLNGNVEEAEWVMDIAKRHSIIKGVVAGLDITSPKLEEVVQSLKPRGLLKGVRHDLDREEDYWIARDDVSRGLDILGKHNLSYDLFVRPHHLKHIPGVVSTPHPWADSPEVVSKHRNTKFIINHIANPPVDTGDLDEWKGEMAAIAKFPNVYCKISGLISEQDPDTWKQIDFQPCIDHVLKIFGADRCIYGSDWPVFKMVGASYTENFSLIRNLLSNLDEEDQIKIFRENAIKFYSLDI